MLTTIRHEEPTLACIEGNSAIKAVGRDTLGLTRSRWIGWGALAVEVARGVIRRRDRASQAFFRRVKSGEAPGYPRFKPSVKPGERAPGHSRYRKIGRAHV